MSSRSKITHIIILLVLIFAAEVDGYAQDEKGWNLNIGAQADVNAYLFLNGSSYKVTPNIEFTHVGNSFIIGLGVNRPNFNLVDFNATGGFYPGDSIWNNVFFEKEYKYMLNMSLLYGKYWNFNNFGVQLLGKTGISPVKRYINSNEENIFVQDQTWMFLNSLNLRLLLNLGETYRTHAFFGVGLSVLVDTEYTQGMVNFPIGFGISYKLTSK